jgi:Zn-dependent peptidase ImmA (M78 family)/transcriptional regulator with XRE-family HTH domain
MAQGEHINPKVLRWARETAGLTVAEAAEKLGLKDTAKASAVQKLQALEDGKRDLAQTTLQKAASLYRRPLIAFYLAEPPTRGDRGEDFRSSKTTTARENGTLDALLRDVRARQQMVREVLEDADEFEPRAFVGSARVGDGPAKVAASIRTALGVSEEQQRHSKDAVALFSVLRAATERTGVYVLLLGDVGSHHSDIGEDVFRGFALADDLAPFVVINDNDAGAARSFTLMHELGHIWLGASGVSGPLRDVPDNVIERFCNDMASEFLLPPDAIPDCSGLLSAPLNDVTGVIQSLAATWNVSEPAVAYRFAKEGWIERQVASTLFAVFAERWRQEKQRRRDNRQLDDMGPGYYTLRRYRLGAGLLGVVRRALQEETLTHTRAAKILGVGPASVSPLLHEERFAAG